jgi:hypothetical protein
VPTVSVIIPNYNHARFLRQRVDSVLGQTFQDFELILLDDCSSDGSQSILREYASDPRVRMEFNEKNSGSTFKQWNKGVRLARGRYVWIAESDDYADAHLLEQLVSRLDTEPTAVMCNCRSWQVSSDDEIIGFLDSYLADLDSHKWTVDYCADGRDECRNFLVVCNTIPNASAAVFRKAAYERAGGADENLRLCGDWKVWAAMALRGSIAYVSDPLNYFRSHDQSVRDISGLGVTALESLHVSRWITSQIRPPEIALEKMYLRQAKLWVPSLLSAHVPLRTKWEIVREVRSVDPQPFRHAIHPALLAVRLKLARHLPFTKTVG